MIKACAKLLLILLCDSFSKERWFAGAVKASVLRRRKVGAKCNETQRRPTILDTDYGPFVDDGFALGLALEADDVFDLKMVMATSIEVELTAKCMAGHLQDAGHTEVIVGKGSSIENVTRAGICTDPDVVGFPLREMCINVTYPLEEDGVKVAAELILKSNRSDWVYISLGATKSVRSLKERFSEAADRIDMMFVMGGNFCDEYEPYFGVQAPVSETNTACDPESMTAMSSEDGVGQHLFFTPVVVHDAIYKEDYAKVVAAAKAGLPGPAAILDFYRTWSEAARRDPTLAVHGEAWAYDPETESPPLYDPSAIMMAIQVLTDDTTYDYLSIHDIIDGVHFNSSAHTSIPDTFEVTELPAECPSLVDATFNLDNKNKRPAKVALGWVSNETRRHFFKEMARRMSSDYSPSLEKSSRNSAYSLSSESCSIQLTYVIWLGALASIISCISFLV